MSEGAAGHSRSACIPCGQEAGRPQCKALHDARSTGAYCSTGCCTVMPCLFLFMCHARTPPRRQAQAPVCPFGGRATSRPCPSRATPPLPWIMINHARYKSACLPDGAAKGLGRTEVVYSQRQRLTRVGLDVDAAVTGAGGAAPHAHPCRRLGVQLGPDPTGRQRQARPWRARGGEPGWGGVGWNNRRGRGPYCCCAAAPVGMRGVNPALLWDAPVSRRLYPLRPAGPAALRAHSGSGMSCVTCPALRSRCTVSRSRRAGGMSCVSGFGEMMKSMSPAVGLPRT